MSKLALISISTYRKPDALRVLLQSLKDYRYSETCVIHVADDFNGQVIEELGYSAKSVAQLEFGTEFSCGERGGVSRNKNRGIKFFLDYSEELPYILLLDDDQQMVAPGLIEELADICEKDNINHVTGKWTEEGAKEIPQLTGQGWSQTFKPQGYGVGDRISWHEGCHGNAQFYTRKCIKRIGYYPLMPKMYSYEHAIHSAMAMKVVDKRTPIWYPQHTRAHKFYVGQNIPNRYSMKTVMVKILNPQTGLIEDVASTEEIQGNDPVYKKMMSEIAQGLLRKNKDSGI